MDGIPRYGGGGGQMQQAYVRNIRARYMRMRDSAIEQQIEGFGQWEILQQARFTLTGEARDLYDEFMENWDALNPACANERRAENTKMGRARWRTYRRVRALWMTQRATCGLTSEPVSVAQTGK